MINGNVTPALNFSKTGYLCPIFVQFLYKFNSFSASTSWLSEQNKDIPIKCWRYANKIPQTLRSTYQNWHSQQRHLENKQNLQIAPMTCSLLFRKKKGYHKIWYQPILQRPARWQRNDVDWPCQKTWVKNGKYFQEIKLISAHILLQQHCDISCNPSHGEIKTEQWRLHICKLKLWLPLWDNPPKLTRMDWRMPRSHWDYKLG